MDVPLVVVNFIKWFLRELTKTIVIHLLLVNFVHSMMGVSNCLLGHKVWTTQNLLDCRALTTVLYPEQFNSNHFASLLVSSVSRNDPRTFVA